MGAYVFAAAVFSAGFFFLFMAFNTAQNLESKLVTDNRLVNTSLALLYGTFTTVAVFAPKIVNVIGPRLGMGLGAVPYVLLVFCMAQPSDSSQAQLWGTFMVAFCLVGVGAAVLWTSQGIALSRLAIAEAALRRESPEIVTSRFNSLFWTVFQFNGALGLSIASTILLLIPSVDTAKTYLFLGFGVIGGIGCIILFFIPMPAHTSTDSGGANRALIAPGDPHDDESKGKGRESKEVTMYETLRLVYSSRAMQLLVPIIFYNGASLGYFSAMYPLAYSGVNETNIDTKFVGFISASFFLANSICSYAWGVLIPRVGRRPLFAITAVTHVGFYLIVLLILFQKTGVTAQSAQAFALVVGNAILFALGDSVLESQVPAIVQSPTFFKEERDRDAANSNLRFWQSLGYTAQFVIGIVVPNNVKVQTYTALPLMVIALTCFFILDRFVRPIETPGKGAYMAIETEGAGATLVDALSVAASTLAEHSEDAPPSGPARRSSHTH